MTHTRTIEIDDSLLSFKFAGPLEETAASDLVLVAYVFSRGIHARLANANPCWTGGGMLAG